MCLVVGAAAWAFAMSCLLELSQANSLSQEFNLQPQTDGEERYHNVGAVAVLKGPTWDEPGFVQYDAVLPRPEVQATYEV